MESQLRMPRLLLLAQRLHLPLHNIHHETLHRLRRNALLLIMRESLSIHGVKYRQGWGSVILEAESWEHVVILNGIDSHKGEVFFEFLGEGL
jgi:hypothetical protein